MFLHLGRDIVIHQKNIISILDLDTSTFSRFTQKFINLAEKAGKVITVSDELPRSAVLCMENGKETVYISSISSKTLVKRAEGGPDEW